MSSTPAGERQVERFHWRETAARLEEWHAAGPLVLGPAGRSFVRIDGEGRVALEVAPPLVMPIRPETRSVEGYLHGLRRRLGRELVLLHQAGASAMGLWRDDELLRHKVIKKYVVRGRGRAQPLHLKTKGKSRYGSRLRLRNARSLLEETNEKLHEWWREEGRFEHVYYSCPQRTWPELFRARPAPPFAEDGPLTKIPLDVRQPTFSELRRIRWELTHGKVVIGRRISAGGDGTMRRPRA